MQPLGTIDLILNHPRWITSGWFNKRIESKSKTNGCTIGWFLVQFIGASAVCILAEIGGILTLNFARIQVSFSTDWQFYDLTTCYYLVRYVQVEQVVQHGWTELNQGTRNLVQTSVSVGFVHQCVKQYSYFDVISIWLLDLFWSVWFARYFNLDL